MSLHNLEIRLREGGELDADESTKLVQENAIDGKLLREAANEGFINVVEFFIKARHRLDASPLEKDKCSNEGAADSEGTTPLHLAASRGHCTVVERLIASGAVVDIENDNKETPLYMACREGQASVLLTLLRHAASPEPYSWRDNKWPVEIAAARGHCLVVDCLLRAGVRIDGALHFAVDGGHEDIVSLILRHHPYHPNQWNDGVTALHRATLMGHARICELILDANANVSSLDFNSRTPLHIAASRGHVDIVRLLLSRGARVDQESWRETPLHCATAKGHLSVVQLLLESNARIEARDIRHHTPLDIAMETGHKNIALLLHSRGGFVNEDSHMKEAIGNGRFLALLSLIALGADPYAMEGTTALHVACRHNQQEIVRFLLNSNLLSQTKDSARFSSLHTGRTQTKDVLNIRDSRLLTPLHLASEFSLQTFLVQNGADPSIPDDRGQTPLHQARNIHYVSLLLQCNVLVDARDEKGRTPLACACADGRRDIAELLIEQGASVNTFDKESKTPLYMALKHCNYDVAGFLLEHDADVNARCGSRAESCLHLLASRGDVEAAQLLLEWGAEVNAEDRAGDTPLQLAVKEGELDVARLLIDHGAEVDKILLEGMNPRYHDKTMELVQLLFKTRSGANKQSNNGTY